MASGKGGTGKTTVATCLALSLAENHGETGTSIPPLLLDCDVEAPNAHLLMEPAFHIRRDVYLPIPEVNDEACTRCGLCAEVCQFQAIAVLGREVLVFKELCHGCGSCTGLCPEEAIVEVPTAIGVMQRGVAKSGVDFGRGVLNVGEPMAGPVIRELKRWATPEDGQAVIMDVPPGTSCPVVDSIRGEDFLILVTEPTPFGLHDLQLAAQLAHTIGLPAGVVVNRDGVGDQQVDAYCEEQGLPILLRIPYGRDIAEGIARGRDLLEIRPGFGGLFRSMFAWIADGWRKGNP